MSPQMNRDQIAAARAEERRRARNGRHGCGPTWPWDAGYAVYPVHIASTLCAQIPFPLHPVGAS